MHRPPVNNTPLDSPITPIIQRPSLALQPLPPLPQLIQTAPRRRARVLRVLREGDRAPAAPAAEPVSQQPPVHVLGERVCVAEGDVGLVRRCFGRQLVEQLAHLGALVLRPLADRRAAADGRVLFLDLGRASLGDERAEVALETAEGDEVAVGLVQGGLAWLGDDRWVEGGGPRGTDE